MKNRHEGTKTYQKYRSSSEKKRGEYILNENQGKSHKKKNISSKK